MTIRSSILSQIAEALAVPVETFTSVDQGSSGRLASADECVDLLDAFEQIGDRQARRRCLIARVYGLPLTRVLALRRAEVAITATFVILWPSADAIPLGEPLAGAFHW